MVELNKHDVPDLGNKLAILERVLGAYLPIRVFEADLQMNMLGLGPSSFSRLRSGQRPARNHELSRLVELFGLSDLGFDYRLFLADLSSFDAALEAKGVGSYGLSAGACIRKALRDMVAPGADIEIEIIGTFNVTGIGHVADATSLVALTRADEVRLKIPLAAEPGTSSHLILLHDHPAAHATSCLVPSFWAPRTQVSGRHVSIPKPPDALPVAGEPGYRCLYGVETPTDLTGALGLAVNESAPAFVTIDQWHVLVRTLANMPDRTRAKCRVSFAEYVFG